MGARSLRGDRGWQAADEGAPGVQGVNKAELAEQVKAALYASKICSYAQGMNIIREKSLAKDWGIDLGNLARIWKVGRSPLHHN